MSADRLSDGYEPNFDIDLAFGKQGELFVKRIQDALADQHAEVKTDAVALRTNNVYVEYQCLRRGRWTDSGIRTTTSTVWVFVIGVIAVAVPTDSLRSIVAHYWPKQSWHRAEENGSHPTRGLCIPITLFIKAAADGGSRMFPTHTP